MTVNRTTLTIAVALLVVASATGGVVAQATAQSADQPKTPEEFVTALNDLRGSEALAEYPELDLARSQAVVEIQTAESFTDADRRRMQSLLASLQAFQRAYGNASERPVRSLDAADESYQALEDLESAGGDSYAALGFVALERFYGVQGDRIYEAAQSATSTPRELELLDAAVHAYQRSGDAQQYSKVKLERDEVRSEYRSDTDRHEELTATASGFVSGCDAACEGPMALLQSGPVASFGTYANALSAYHAAADAAGIADEHGIADRSDAADLRDASFDALVNAAIVSVGLVAAYALALTALAWAVVWRLSKWAEDAHTAATDRIVSPLEVENA